MVVECPNCATKYNLADELARPGALCRCKVCGHIFPLPGGENEDDSFFQDAGNAYDDVEFDENISYERFVEDPKKTKRYKILQALLVILLTALITFIGIYFFSSDEREDKAKQEEEQRITRENEERAKQVTMLRYKRTIENTKYMGQLIIGTCEVQSNSSVPLSTIIVHIELLDADQATLLFTDNIVCDVLLNFEQVNDLNKTMLASRLNAEVNFRKPVNPGQTVLCQFFVPNATPAMIDAARDPNRILLKILSAEL